MLWSGPWVLCLHLTLGLLSHKGVLTRPSWCRHGWIFLCVTCRCGLDQGCTALVHNPTLQRSGIACRMGQVKALSVPLIINETSSLVPLWHAFPSFYFLWNLINFIDLKRQDRQRSSICSFTTVEARSDWNWGPGTPSRPPQWGTRTQVVEPLLAASQIYINRKLETSRQLELKSKHSSMRRMPPQWNLNHCDKCQCPHSNCIYIYHIYMGTHVCKLTYNLLTLCGQMEQGTM